MLAQGRMTVTDNQVQLLNELKSFVFSAWGRVRAFFGYYSDLALPAKLALSAVIGLLAGPGVVGFVSEYATYHFALHEGVRPPLEGIPYLRAAVTTATFLLLASATIAFLLFLTVARIFVDNIRKAIMWPYYYYDPLDYIFSFVGRLLGINLQKLYTEIATGALTRFEQVPFKIVAILAATAGIFVGLSIALLFYLSSKPFIQPGVFAAIGIFVSIFLVWRSAMAWWTAAAGALVLCAAVIAAMFNAQYYGKFLRYLRYGGGIPVLVELDAGDSRPSTYAAYLVLRTSESLLLFEPVSRSTREIPM